ncbi:MAG: DNA polymerase III subunit gamma/tau [Xanthomonadaceae bacterium]|nr:DNA polymerase III subunit gamma/tau [Xanthomonadaceae bacterium]
MNTHVALARKWRPAQFSDIVGQSAVVRTLINAVRLDRIHPAYLFTGSRGVGKTSIARIFAKALRCENRIMTETDVRSCDKCSQCLEIATSRSMDVIEIDGASNNGVDAVRDIRENVRFMPSTGTRKVYIIDEVHMLTTAAFNALLKTLEEPPAHVVFVFATTEPHKIPSTVHSRCQRFHFQRGSSAQLQTLLTGILKSENVQCETAALSLISKAADGSMRDSLSLLDQIIAFSGDKITVGSARESLGLIESQLVIQVLRGVLDRKIEAALAATGTAFESGHDLKILLKDLIEYLHGVILCKLKIEKPQTLEISDEDWSELAKLSASRDLEELELIFQVFHHGYETLVRSPHPKVALDLILIKCATAEALIQIGDEPAQAKTITATTPVARSAPTTVVAKQDTAVAKPVTVSAPTAPAPVQATFSGPKSWEGFVQFVRTQRPLVGSFLEHAAAGIPSETELEIAFKPEDGYKKDQLKSKLYMDTLGALIQTYFGKPLKLVLSTRDQAVGGESMAEKKEREIKTKEKLARDTALNDPIIKEAKALFGAELGPIELLEPGETNHR